MTEREIFESYGLNYDTFDWESAIKGKQLDDWFFHENNYMEDEAVGIYVDE